MPYKNDFDFLSVNPKNLKKVSSHFGALPSLKEEYSKLDHLQRIYGLTAEEMQNFINTKVFNQSLDQLAQYRPMKPYKEFTVNKNFYLVVQDGMIIYANDVLENCKSKAAESSYKSKSPVLIFKPILEIAPKYDTVETPIDLK